MESLRRIVQALRESSRRAEQQVGLSGAQLFVLAKLAEAPALSLNELAERTHTHQSSVSTVVSRLVGRGLVRRVRAKDDRRCVALTLSREGQRLIARAPGAAQDRLIAGIERLSPGSRRQLADGLATVAREMDAEQGRAAMFFDERQTRRKDRRPNA
jgi:DNA-binding MarR family transcriptional regulator